MNRISFLLALALASFEPGTCLADCYRDCMLDCYYGRSDDEAYCRGRQVRCSTDCRHASDTNFGAIAYSASDGGYGWSNGWSDQKKAEKVALENCREHGSNCEIQVWFYNSCGAVAANGGFVGWGHDSSEGTAKKTALEKCANAGGKNCALKTSHCSF